MFTDNGIRCEDVKTPGVDVRQDPFQFLLEEKCQIAKDEQTYQNQVLVSVIAGHLSKLPDGQ